MQKNIYMNTLYLHFQKENFNLCKKKKCAMPPLRQNCKLIKKYVSNLDAKHMDHRSQLKTCFTFETIFEFLI